MLYFWWWWCSYAPAGGKWEIISNVCNKINFKRNTLNKATESPLFSFQKMLHVQNGIDDGHQIENQMYLLQYHQQLYYWKIRLNKRQHNIYWSTIGRNEVLSTSNESFKLAASSFWIHVDYMKSELWLVWFISHFLVKTYVT